LLREERKIRDALDSGHPEVTRIVSTDHQIELRGYPPAVSLKEAPLQDAELATVQARGQTDAPKAKVPHLKSRAVVFVEARQINWPAGDERNVIVPAQRLKGPKRSGLRASGTEPRMCNAYPLAFQSVASDSVAMI